jgi:ferredoxin
MSSLVDLDTDEMGLPIIAGDGTFGPELAERAQLAVDNCPERAITIE